MTVAEPERPMPSMAIPVTWLVLLSVVVAVVLGAIGNWGLELKSAGTCVREALASLATDAAGPACTAVATRVVHGGRWARFYVWLDFAFIAAYAGFLLCALLWIHERASTALDPQRYPVAAMWVALAGILAPGWGVPLVVGGAVADLYENALLLDAMPSQILPEALPAKLVIATGLKWLMGLLALAIVVLGLLVTNPWPRWIERLRGR